MRFAVIGDAPSARPIVRSVAALPEHDLALFALAPRLFADLRPMQLSARFVPGWEELLTTDRLDAVIVAGDDETSLNAAKQLAAAGKTLLVCPAAGLTATFAYELALVLADQPVCLVPWFTLRAHPLVGELRARCSSGVLGEIRHVLLERRIVPSDSAAASQVLARADLVAAFLPDADLLRSIWGEYDQVTAIRSSTSAGAVSLAHITLAGPAVPQVVWSASAAVDAPLWKLTIVGQQGAATLQGDPDTAACSLDWSTADGSSNRETATFDAAQWLLAGTAARAAARSQSAASRGAADPIGPAGPDWDDFTRAVDLFDAIERSVRRRRTIDIHFETPSERGQFKTQMTAIGCGVLLLTLAAFTAYLLTESIFDLPQWIKGTLWVLTFLPLGVFLLFQALLFVTRPSAGAGEREKMVDGE